MNPLAVPNFVASPQPRNGSHAGARSGQDSSSFDTALHGAGRGHHAGRKADAGEQAEPMRRLATQLAEAREQERSPAGLADLELVAKAKDTLAGDDERIASDEQGTDDADAALALLNAMARVEDLAKARRSAEAGGDTLSADAAGGKGNGREALRALAAGGASHAASSHLAAPIEVATDATSSPDDGSSPGGQVTVLDTRDEGAPGGRAATGIAAMLGDSLTRAGRSDMAGSPLSAEELGGMAAAAGDRTGPASAAPEGDPDARLGPVTSAVGAPQAATALAGLHGDARRQPGAAPGTPAGDLQSLGLSGGGIGNDDPGIRTTATRDGSASRHQSSAGDQAGARAEPQQRDRQDGTVGAETVDRPAARAAEIPLVPARSAATIASIVEPFLASASASPTSAAAHAAAETVSSTPHSLKIQLRPADLGVVTATLRMAGDVLTVEMTPEKVEAYERLSLDSDAIVKALRGVGLQVDQVTIQQPQIASTKPEGNAPMQASGGNSQQFAETGGSSGHGADGRREASSNGGNQNGGQARGTSLPADQAGAGSGLFI